MHSFKIPISSPAEKFKKVLNMDDNNKIFFSGKFGSGKTYFLNEFFKEKEEEYQVFHLYPSSYYIEGDKDIFDLIKADILLKILNLNNSTVSVTEENVKNGANLSSEDLKNVICSIPHLGKPLKEWRTFYETIKNTHGIKKSEEKEMEKYIDSVQSDTVSYFIDTKIKELKKQKSVLIIDDLDRLFPEHIFRILNLLSSQGHEDVAPFGFDHLILVGDYENVRKIYHHKYGCCDFDGYMSKFYSKEVFDFCNIDETKKNLKDIIVNSTESSDPVESGYIICRFPSKIFLDGLQCGVISIRDLTKYNNFAFKEGGHNNTFGTRTGSYYVNGVIQGLNSALGSKDITINTLLSIKEKLSIFDETDSDILTWICRYIVEDKAKSLIRDDIDFTKYKDGEPKIYGTGFEIKSDIEETIYNKPICFTDRKNWFFVPNPKCDLNKLMYDLLIEYIRNNGEIKITVGYDGVKDVN